MFCILRQGCGEGGESVLCSLQLGYETHSSTPSDTGTHFAPVVGNFFMVSASQRLVLEQRPDPFCSQNSLCPYGAYSV